MQIKLFTKHSLDLLWDEVRNDKALDPLRFDAHLNDPLQYVMDTFNLPFHETVELFAKRYGITLEVAGKRGDNDA